NALAAPIVLRNLARRLVEDGASAEAAVVLKRAVQIEEAINSLPRDSSPAGDSAAQATLPEVRFLESKANGEVQGDEVTGSCALLSPLRPPAAPSATAGSFAAAARRPRRTGGRCACSRSGLAPIPMCPGSTSRRRTRATWRRRWRHRRATASSIVLPA